MKLLAFETATEACSVAVWVDGAVRERFEIAPRRHAALALPWAEALLAEAGVARRELDAIAVGIGPGAFTGVRLAVALAQGIALGLDLPVVPVSTLRVLAQSGPADAAQLVAAIDARMGEVYCGAFVRDADGLVSALGAERLLDPAKADFEAAAGAVGVGTGFASAGGVLGSRLGITAVHADVLPRASCLARLAAREFAAGRFVAADALEPAYLRDRVALTLVEQGKA
jgi:tRNA threonylcarbamoyladenosine biosynthesis protein TsaB